MIATADQPVALEEFMAAYIEAALWSSTDNADDSGGEPLDKSYGPDDIAAETLDRMRADCLKFLNHKLGGRLITIAERLETEGRWSPPAGAECTVMEHAGHDLWLTRNGHGCGFRDGGWPRDMGEGLDKLAKQFGQIDLYIGDDGLIYGV